MSQGNTFFTRVFTKEASFLELLQIMNRLCISNYLIIFKCLFSVDIKTTYPLVVLSISRSICIEEKG